MTSASGWRVGLFNNLLLAQLLHFSSITKEMHEFVDCLPYKECQGKEGSPGTYRSSWSGTALLTHCLFFCFVFAPFCLND